MEQRRINPTLKRKEFIRVPPHLKFVRKEVSVKTSLGCTSRRKTISSIRKAWPLLRKKNVRAMTITDMCKGYLLHRMNGDNEKVKTNVHLSRYDCKNQVDAEKRESCCSKQTCQKNPLAVRSVQVKVLCWGRPTAPTKAFTGGRETYQNLAKWLWRWAISFRIGPTRTKLWDISKQAAIANNFDHKTAHDSERTLMLKNKQNPITHPRRCPVSQRRSSRTGWQGGWSTYK